MKEDFKGVPDCGDLSCTAAKIVWEDGKRYVKGADDKTYVPFDSFVTTALQAIIHDLDDIKKRLALMAEFGLPIPFTHRSPDTVEDRSGLVP